MDTERPREFDLVLSPLAAELREGVRAHQVEYYITNGMVTDLLRDKFRKPEMTPDPAVNYVGARTSRGAFAVMDASA